MSKSKIEWTDVTWNPVTGCSKISEGCKNCYAEVAFNNQRTMDYPKNVYRGRKFTDVQCHEDRLQQPLKWKKPKMIFVNSMSDLFHENIKYELIDKIFAVMALCPQHTFQILTKRPERMLDYFNKHFTRHKWGIEAREFSGKKNIFANTDWGCDPDICNVEYPLKNVWLGVSVEDQKTADERIPLLLNTPAAVRWISAEPLLGKINLTEITRPDHPGVHVFNALWCDVPAKDDVWNGAVIDWVVAGGESGPNARPIHPDWVKSLRDQCIEAGAAFFFKQWGEWCPATLDYGVLRSAVFESSAKFTWIGFDGKTKNSSCYELKYPVVAIAKMGKKKSGRVLDRREWNEYPEVR